MGLVLAAIFTTLVLGIPVALAVDRQCRGGALVGLSYLYGGGLIWAVLFALSLLHIAWSAIASTVVALAAATLFAVLARRKALEPATIQRAAWSPAGLAIDLLTGYTVVSYALYATLAPVWEWDFWAIWGLKGRVFFEARGIDWLFLQSPFNDFAHPDYPLLLPLNYAFVALGGGSWDDRWMALLGTAFGVALIFIVRSLAARERPGFLAALVTFAIAGVALSEYVGLADAPLIAYGTAAILFIRRGLLFDEASAFRHGAILLGLAASTKNEGLALIPSIVIAMLIARVSKWRSVLRLWPAAAIPLPWIVARAAFHLSTDLARGSFVSRVIERIGACGSIGVSLLQWLPDPWLWLLMLAGIVIIPRPRRSAERFVFAVVAIQAVWYLAAYFGTPHDVLWQIETSWPRVARHLEGPLLFVVMMTLAEVFSRAETFAHAETRSDIQ